MTETNAVIWLVVGLALLALLVAVPAISAHGNGTVPENATATDGPYQTTIDERAVWMADHMTTRWGANATEWMDVHMGMSDRWTSAQTGMNDSEWMRAHMGVNGEWTDDENASVGPFTHAPAGENAHHDEYHDDSVSGYGDHHDDQQGYRGMNGRGHGC
ncbi:hypothetical protein [Halorhabdus rudnickae]|uniref:hypothetical protein n=1 Tax=Halorhabdus rudnickae TaxID=1775544 RepID=UPI001082A594|nr:hypothetical protein [Halorhabdus rudnickae]